MTIVLRNTPHRITLAKVLGPKGKLSYSLFKWHGLGWGLLDFSYQH